MAKRIKKFAHYDSEEEAYTAAVLHALRDRLLMNEAVQLAAEMPMLIRGMYYEGWSPSGPSNETTEEGFIENVRLRLKNATNRIDPKAATSSVFEFLGKKISAGEISDIKGQLPNSIVKLWH